MNNLESHLGRDPWLASSLLQKAIRRGEVATAVAAGRAFRLRRGNGVWRRLAVIAIEDIGVADSQVVHQSVRYAFHATHKPADSALEQLIEALAPAPKDRSSDYLCSHMVRSSLAEPEREQCGSSSTDRLLDLVLSRTVPMVLRATACWYLSGVNVNSEPRFLTGRLEQLCARLRQNGVEDAIVDAVATAQKIGHPFPVTLPIFWQERRTEGAVMQINNNLSAATTQNGVPLYAFDKHTRIGKAANRQFLRECTTVRETIGDWANEIRAQHVVDMAAFYAEAIGVRRKLIWSDTPMLEALGLNADMEHVGVSPGGVEAIVTAVRENLDQLAAIKLRLAN